MLARLARLWRRPASVPASAPVLSQPQTPTFDAAVGAIGMATNAWCRRRRDAAAAYAGISREALANLRQHQAERTRLTIAAAEGVLHHEFDLLGSGPYVPLDPDRPARAGYRPIDWHLDPVRQLRYPRGFSHRTWDFNGMRPGNADVKYPWELSRCQHWITLGQAYRLTDDDRFAIEMSRQLDDFMESNPVGTGVNWSCTMDVGLRAVSWVIGLDMVRTSPALNDAFWMRAYTSLYDHGVFIGDNLENKYEVTSNHFLSNLVGLLFVGSVFSDLPQGAGWNTFARSALEHELTVQVLPDGADYESSIPYHRLVTELFLGSARLAAHQGQPMSPVSYARLREMVAFLAAVTRPDGLMPQVGDADDGRLHIFDGGKKVTPQDGRHIFGPASVMFDQPAWMALAGDVGPWESAWWGFDVTGTSRPPHRAESRGRHFPHAGIAVARSEAGHYLIVTNGVVGTNGFGNHKHNDQLSFEYHQGGTPLIVDPGSYVYTCDPDARNRFRSTAYHNTAAIDGVEQNDLRPDFLFRLFETANAETVSFEDGPEAVEYVGRHHGYERLPEPVSHERRFRFTKSDGELRIVDRFTGRGAHTFRWHFHLAPGISAERTGETSVRLTGDGRQWVLTVPAGVDLAIEPAEYSPSYGVAVPCVAINVSLHETLAGERRCAFSISP
jgi:Heparinase II/III-like protein/Heparinase II/III N-terminus